MHHQGSGLRSIVRRTMDSFVDPPCFELNDVTFTINTLYLVVIVIIVL